MGNDEVMQMMIDLVEMPEKNFNDCQEYVKNIDASDKTKAFFEEMMRVALVKREKLKMV
jgi:hypothetical protein